MKLLNLFLSVFIVLGMSLLSCKGGKDKTTDSSGDLSEQLQTISSDFKNQEYKLPVELGYGRVSKDFIQDKFYPIGWSKDGKFAYIVEPADEGSGFYWFEMVIMDMINNKVAWSWKPKESEQGNLEDTWKENYDLFKNQLAANEIHPQDKFELKPIKTTYKDDVFELILDTKNSTDPDFGFEVVKELNIKLSSEQLGQKVVVNQKEDDYSNVIGAIISGFLLSPFDDRILVICKKDRIGYEGPPNVVYFELFGSDLVRGFKKGTKS